MVVGPLAMVPPGTISSVPSPICEEVTSEAREVRSFVGWNVSALMYYQFEHLDTIVSQVMSLCFLTTWYVTPYNGG